MNEVKSDLSQWQANVTYDGHPKMDVESGVHQPPATPPSVVEIEKLIDDFEHKCDVVPGALTHGQDLLNRHDARKRLFAAVRQLAAGKAYLAEQIVMAIATVNEMRKERDAAREELAKANTEIERLSTTRTLEGK